MSVVSINTQARIAELRQRAKETTLTLEEMREVIRLLRADRLAMPASKTSGSKKAPPPDADSLLSELGL